MCSLLKKRLNIFNLFPPLVAGNLVNVNELLGIESIVIMFVDSCDRIYNVFICRCVCVCLFVCLFAVNGCVYMYVCMYVYMYVCLCAYVRINVWKQK